MGAMSTTTEAPTGQSQPTPSTGGHRFGDVLFKGVAVACGVLILLVLAGVFFFLLSEGMPAFTAGKGEIPGGILGYIGPLIFGTIFAAILALIIALPLSVGIALFISHYAPRRIASLLGYFVDLLAAVPSVVYGLWGIYFLAPQIRKVFPWLHDNLGWLPFFSQDPAPHGRTMATAAVVLAVMILPIMTAVNREVFLQTPRLQEEAALALGATRFEMIRMTVLPFGKSGITSGAMLGLGRAMGETIAVAMVLGGYPGLVSLNLSGTRSSSTVAANIALKFPESSGIEVNALIASGLALFLFTFLVNFAARWIIARSAEFSGADA
jgi:phosphate transport system permease protein